MAKQELTPIVQVWNRACDSLSQEPLRLGDHALKDMLRAHGLICNGGVFHAFDVLTREQIEAAKSGYRFYGFHEIVDLLSRAKELLDEDAELGEYEERLDRKYSGYIGDSELYEHFKQHFAAKPSDFAPLTPGGSWPGKCE